MNDVTLSPLPAALRHWRGLGLWNFYFITKFALFGFSLINFHPLYNLALAAFLLFPLPPVWLHRLRHLLAIPAGVALYYYDSWLPPFSRLIAQSSAVESFSADYMLELAGRFINWNWLAIGLVMLLSYLFLSQFIRFSALIFAYLLYVAASPYLPTLISRPAETVADDRTVPQTALRSEVTATGGGYGDNSHTEIGSAGAGTAAPQPQLASVPDDQVLNSALAAFYQQQSQQVTTFSPIPSENTPFDVLILNICSLSWSDMETVGLRDHPLWNSMDVVFDEFNSASTYSGPAMIRLLRASCGQESNAGLFKPADPQCYLFENLKKIGFNESWAMNHDGHFGDFVQEARTLGNLQTTPMPFTGLTPAMTSFDGSPIYRDISVLDTWWKNRIKSGSAREALYYNTISLHDGNRMINAQTGKTARADYKQSLRTLFDDLNAFLQQLEKSGRPVMVVIVPEHGAALKGDMMQISGMREIPSPSIVHVPVGVKFINAKSVLAEHPMHITKPSSYLAISQLVASMVGSEAYSRDNVDLAAMVNALPETTPVVAANEGSVMLRYNNKEYLSLDMKSWLPYPATSAQ
ncbi:MAG: cellulose biosynthesis protein BcsG [Plesiomonas sp.]|uniref:cellulose biosynthesis protein BcsG n=1 Tax=Plesiomonas sp. TaxID=2486279 RepID=UPI003F3C4B0B